MSMTLFKSEATGCSGDQNDENTITADRLSCASTSRILFAKLFTLKKVTIKRFVRKFYVIYSIQFSVVNMSIAQYMVVFIRKMAQNKHYQKNSL